MTFARHFRRDGGAVFPEPSSRGSMTARSLCVMNLTRSMRSSQGAGICDLDRRIDESAFAQRIREAAIPTEDER